MELSYMCTLILTELSWSPKWRKGHACV